MHAKKRAFVIVVLILSLLVPGAVYAQEGDPLPCEGAEVDGTVVAVDEEAGTVTIDTGDGLCTVTLSPGTYEHPIVALLGAYFDDVSAENLAAALEEITRAAVQDEEGNWTWADPEDEGAIPVTVVAVIDNGDGTYTIELAVEGEEEHVFLITDDGDLVMSLDSALNALMVTWTLDEDGTVIEAGDQIAAYHEDGMGFGVLVKLFAMAEESQEACEDSADPEEPCGITVEELVADFQSGVGIGQLFQAYGKPAMVGVGHVRQELKEDQGNKPDWAGPPPWAGPNKNQDQDQDQDQDQSGPPGLVGPKMKDKHKNKDNGNGNGNAGGNGNGNGNGGPPWAND